MRRIFVQYYDSFIMEVPDDMSNEEIVDQAFDEMNGSDLLMVKDFDTDEEFEINT